MGFQIPDVLVDVSSADAFAEKSDHLIAPDILERIYGMSECGKCGVIVREQVMRHDVIIFNESSVEACVKDDESGSDAVGINVFRVNVQGAAVETVLSDEFRIGGFFQPLDGDAVTFDVIGFEFLWVARGTHLYTEIVLRERKPTLRRGNVRGSVEQLHVVVAMMMEYGEIHAWLRKARKKSVLD